MSRGRVAPALLGAGLVLAGCGGDTPRIERIERSIAASDSLRRRPLPERELIRPGDLPVAAGADSDSVAWLRIQTEPAPPKGPPTL